MGLEEVGEGVDVEVGIGVTPVLGDCVELDPVEGCVVPLKPLGAPVGEMVGA